MSWIRDAIVRSWTPLVTQVRYRYHAEKMARGPLLRRYGYKDDVMEFRGVLPRQDTKRVKEMPLYRPKDAWCQRRALFGQNDYIDILGSEKMHPTRIIYNVPSWLRGVSGNEFKVLIRKQKMWSRGVFPIARPTKWKQLNKRIWYLYKYLNRKTKTQYTSKQ